MFARRRAGGARRGGSQGGTALEFAILSPALFLLLFGLFDIGWALHCASNVRHALEGTGRALELNPSWSQSDLTQDLTQRLKEIPASQLSLTYAKPASYGGVSLGQIEVAYSHTLGYPLADLGQIRFHVQTAVPLNGG